MVDLKKLHSKLSIELKEYELTWKKRFGREVIIVKKDTYRGAEVYAVGNKIQVLPISPTFKGKFLSSSGSSFGKSFFKNYDEVGEKVYRHLESKDEDYEVELIEHMNDIARSEEGKKTDNYVGIGLGVFIIGLAVFLFFEFQKMEQEGGELTINWIVVLLYESFGKTITTLVIGALGVGMIGDGIRKLK